MTESKEAAKETVQGGFDVDGDAVVAISSELRRLLADVFALYLKTKGFHWHMKGRHFRDYHLFAG
jgi:starvation-inducible DNA-binding protein